MKQHTADDTRNDNRVSLKGFKKELTVDQCQEFGFSLEEIQSHDIDLLLIPFQIL